MASPDYQAFAASIGNPLDDQARATAALATSDQLNAARTAGQTLGNGGSYADAARSMFDAGDLAGGQKLIGMGAQIGEASALANRDYTGAAKAAAAGGDTQGVIGAQAQQLQQFRIKQGYIQQALPTLQAANAKFGGAGIAHALDYLAPDLEQLGFTPDQLAHYKQTALADPEGFLHSVNAISAPLDWKPIGEDLVGFNAAGQPVMRFAASKTTTLNRPDGGQDLVQTGGGLAPVGSQISAPAAPQTGQPATPGGPNDNNVGNMRVPGQAAFQTFDSPQGGAVGLSDQLARYGAPKSATNPYGGKQTLMDLAAVYAPKDPKEPTNDPVAWAANVGKAAGIDPNAPINLADPNVRAKLIPAIGQAEGHAAAAQRGLAGLSGPAGSAAPNFAPGTTTLASTSTGQMPTREATPQENAQYNPGGTGQIDAKGKYTAVTKAGDLNNWTPAAIDNAAEQYRTTGILPATRGQGGEAAEQSIINRAAEMDSKDGISPAAALARRTLVSGTIKAQTDLIGTISQMQSYARNANKDFDNVTALAQQALSSGGVKTVREFQQWIKEQKGDDALGAFNTALTDAKGNYAKIVLGAGTGTGGAPGTGPERQDLDKLFNDDLPLHTLISNVQQARVGINNRLDEQTRQYQLNDQIIKTGKFDPTIGNPPTTPTAASGAPPPGAIVVRYGPNGKRLQ